MNGIKKETEITISSREYELADRQYWNYEYLKTVIIKGVITNIGQNVFSYRVLKDLVIIAPKMPLFAFPDYLFLPSVRGFLILYKEKQEIDALVIKENLKFIKNKRKKLYEEALKDKEFLHFFIKERMIPQKEVELLLEKTKDTENIAELLDYAKSFEVDLSFLELDDKIPISKNEWVSKIMAKGTLNLTSYKGVEQEVVVPEHIKNVPVTHMDKLCCSPYARRLTQEQQEIRKQITSIIIPASIEKIARDAFLGCEHVEQIEVSQENKSYFVNEEGLCDKNGTCILKIRK